MIIKAKAAGIIRIAVLSSLILAMIFPAKVSSYGDSYSAEYRMLDEIESYSRIFKRNVERLLFQESFIKISQRKKLEGMTKWLRDNEYPRIREFLDLLTFEDVKATCGLFESGYDVGSSRFIPIIEAEEITGQETVLTFPFENTFFIVQGNAGWVSHFENTSNEFAWDFIVRKEGGMSHGNAGKNKNYYSWGEPVIAPASGVVRRIRNDQKDHRPVTVIKKRDKSNYVIIEHAHGEFSNIHHIMEGSITVKPGDYVERGQRIARVGNTGTSVFPHIHYQLDRGDLDSREARSARFACYFARHKDSQKIRLVFSGVPAEGEYVISADDYVSMKYGEFDDEK